MARGLTCDSAAYELTLESTVDEGAAWELVVKGRYMRTGSHWLG